MYFNNFLLWYRQLQKFKRKEFKKHELLNLFLKKNIIDIKEDQYKLLCQMYLIKKIKRNSISVIKDFCLITGRSRGIIKDFKISRIKFKEFALKGLLPNISKLS